MKNTSITDAQLYIGRIRGVISSVNRNKNKRTYVSGRHSDAFIYALYGTCDYSFDDGTSFTVNAGDVLYLSCGAVYSMLVRTDSYKVIFCDFEFLCDTPRQSAVFTPENTDHVKSLFQKLHRAHTASAPSSFAESLSHLYSIYACAISAKSVGESKTSSARLGIAHRYILSHLDDVSLSVSSLAQMSDMSEVYFRNLFKAKYGASPSEYITESRIKKACELMKYPFLSLCDCAMQSGFSSLQYFCRVFKNEMGTPPSKFRKNQYGI